MGNEPMLVVELVYALPHTVWRKQVVLPMGATALEAVQSSGVLSDFPELDGGHLTLGIFGRLCTHQHVLRDGDRVEIYRPLVFDPMESRRRRQQHRQRKGRRQSARMASRPLSADNPAKMSGS